MSGERDIETGSGCKILRDAAMSAGLAAGAGERLEGVADVQP